MIVDILVNSCRIVLNVPQIHVSVIRSTIEPWIVIIPKNKLDSSIMAFEELTSSAFSSPKVVNEDLLSLGCCKKMPSMRKLNLCASFDSNRFEWDKVIAEDIHHLDFVLESNHYVEPRGVEGHGKTFFSLILVNVQRFISIVPNSNWFILRASYCELFSNTYI